MMKKLIRIIREQFVILFVCIILSASLYAAFIFVGGYKFEEVQPMIFTVIFIPVISLIVNAFVSRQLDEADYIEKEIKQNEYFKEQELITEEQYQKAKINLRQRVQKLSKYK